LLLPLRKLGRRRAERRRLEARLEIREVVGVEQVEDFPEAGGDHAAAELERLADAEVRDSVVVAAPRAARLGPREDDRRARDAPRQRTRVLPDPRQLKI